MYGCGCSGYNDGGFGWIWIIIILFIIFFLFWGAGSCNNRTNYNGGC